MTAAAGGPGTFADGSPIPDQAPGEVSPAGHAELVRRELDRIRAREEANRLAEQMRVVGQHTPVDLGPYVAGAIRRPEPTRGLRIADDGPRVLYPGLEHAVVGEMESGKGWFIAACVAAEIRNGRRVVYLHFEETDPSGVIEQLRMCGAAGDEIVEFLSFVGIEERRGIDDLLKLTPALVILDGVNEAMGLYGHKIREEDGSVAFRRELVKPWTAVGAAVLQADHVTKDSESRGRYALGSIHKGNALNGVLFMLENVTPFGRLVRGMSRVFVTKDRPGHLRRSGVATKLPGKTWLGDMVVDARLDARPESAGLVLYPARPAPERPVLSPEERAAIAAEQLDERVYAAVVSILDHGEEASLNRVWATAGGRKTSVSESLVRLAYRTPARLVETKRGQWKIYTRLTPDDVPAPGSLDQSDPLPVPDGSEDQELTGTS